ncbi:hypothetical protein [Dyella agri]|uniref:Uncharacterized protein n=1 Tax=Dyella agri TaxID=1926869 RepID=A0ABW8KNL3_9GAMM
MKSRLAGIGLFISFLFVGFLSMPVESIATQNAKDSTIVGLGMALPNVPDVSKDKKFHVYEIDKDGVTYVQINNLDRAVVAAVAMTSSGYFTLPIGYLASAKVILPNAKQYGVVQPYDVAAPLAAGDGQCPCSGHVVYTGLNGTIVVVTDRNGNVIQVVVLPPAAATVDP